MNGDKPSDETPLSPQWLSLAPQRSTGSSLLESTGPIQSALLSDNSKVSSKTTMGPFASRTLSTSRSLSSQWGSGEGRKPAGSASLPSDLLFPSAPGGEPYWNEGKSVGRASDSGWHSKKKADSASFDPGSGSGSLYSPLGSGRGTLGGRPTSKPREISRGGWGYSSGDAPRSPRSGVVRRESFNNEQANRGSFSGSYGTSQEGYENFKQSSSIDKKHQLSSSGRERARGGTDGTILTGAGEAKEGTRPRSSCKEVSPFSRQGVEVGWIITSHLRSTLLPRGEGPLLGEGGSRLKGMGLGVGLVQAAAPSVERARSWPTSTTPHPTDTAEASCMMY